MHTFARHSFFINFFHVPFVFFKEKFGKFRKIYYLCIRKRRRRVGRVIDRAGLEIRYTPFGYRGFESLTLRKRKEICF